MGKGEQNQPNSSDFPDKEPKWIERLVERLEVAIEKRVEEKFLAKYKTISHEMKLMRTKNAELEARIANLELHSRRANIEILNIPQRKDENTTTLVMKIGQLVGCPLTAAQVLKSHRNPPRKASTDSQGKCRPAPIVAELANRAVAETLLDKVRDFWKKNRYTVSAQAVDGRLAPEKISVVRQLPGQTKFLLSRCKLFAKENNFKFCWVNRAGRLHLRKEEGAEPIRISNLAQLEGLNSKRKKRGTQDGKEEQEEDSDDEFNTTVLQE